MGIRHGLDRQNKQAGENAVSISGPTFKRESGIAEFEDRFAIVEEKLPAIEMVRKATQNKIGRFTKQDIRELCPGLSLSSVEGSLRKLVAMGELKREGAGKSTCYIRIQ